MSRVIHSCPECGAVLSKNRSLPDHRRTFSIISKAAATWPLSHEFQPKDAEHLRAYLTVRGEHFDVTSIEIAQIASDDKSVAIVRAAVEATVAAMAARGSYAFVRVHAGGVEVLSPKSISWAAMDQKAFSKLRDAIEQEIELAIGVSVQELLTAEAA